MPMRVLVPVWGAAYVRKFVDLTLPTWLSARNLPAVAQRRPTEFVFLTTAADRERLEREPGIERLRAVLPVDYRLIDDLVVPRNHSTVLTLAFAGAIRHFTATLPNPGFIMLVGDLLLSDGALEETVDALAAGSGAVMIGGLQVVDREIEGALLKRAACGGGVLELEPRATVRWALEALHPSMIAAFMDQSVSHSSHPNHFFWRVDDQTVIARYFLMHMIGVRPERRDFEITAPLDFAFMPELCPSGRIKIIDDSDRGIFVEAIGREHEAGFLAPGPGDFEAIVASLARWTTAEQRALSATPVVFHGAAVPDPDHPICRAADAFHARLLARLPPTAQPHRRHPYWQEQYSAFVLERMRAGGAVEAATVGAELAARGRLRTLFWMVLGRPPAVRVWHPFWHDYRVARRRIAAEWLGTAKRILILDEQASPLARWLGDRLPTARWLRADALEPARLGPVDGVLIAIGPGDIAGLAAIVDAVLPALTAGAMILVHATDHKVSLDGRLARAVIGHAGALLRPRLAIEACVYVSGRCQGLTHRSYAAAARHFTRGGGRQVAAALALLVPTLALALIDNLCRRPGGRVRGHCSAVSLVLRRAGP
jgi:hypothetical protein